MVWLLAVAGTYQRLQQYDRYRVPHERYVPPLPSTMYRYLDAGISWDHGSGRVQQYHTRAI